jgi:AcrR family transcriptional regulator
MSEQLTHRERKKWATRLAILHTAERLFLEKGFDETTVDEIAAAAGVSPATVFNYFPSKSDILFADYAALQDEMRHVLHDREAGDTVLDRLRTYVREGRRQLRDPESDRARRRVIDASPGLQAQERLRMARGEAIVAEAVADELGEAPGDLRPRIVGAAVMAVLFATLQHGTQPHAEGHDPVELFEYAVTLLASGYEALAALDAPPF